jgi:hypothetical protein
VEDCGAALATFNIRGAAGRELATAVHRDIWAGALPVLNRLKLCHFDITENNIVVSDADARGHAKLIDLESMTEESVRPRRPRVLSAPRSRPLHSMSNVCARFSSVCRARTFRRLPRARRYCQSLPILARAPS